MGFWYPYDDGETQFGSLAELRHVLVARKLNRTEDQVVPDLEVYAVFAVVTHSNTPAQ